MFPATLALFCKVVDNFGDIGICWRLARQLRHEHDIAVTLWVDHLPSFQRICPQVDVVAELQEVQGVTVRHWQSQDGRFSADEIPDLVIEFFGCELPPGYVEAMARREPRPVWLNLEGLSAEEWVEGCHTLPSMHSRLPLTKHFFFPGFTAKTGGLLREAGLIEQRQRFQSDPAAIQAFLGQLGVTPEEAAGFKVSLFCYPHAPVAAMFEAWQQRAMPVTCLVPEGVASDAVNAFLEEPGKPGMARTRGALTLRVLPFVPQPDYDKLLWSCDFNFVRGEDSIVRAQWAARPFVWHIYPQDKNLHHVKLRAFLQRFAPGIDSINAFAMRWNDAPAQGAFAAADWPALWAHLQDDLAALKTRIAEWESQMVDLGDITSNMLKFTASTAASIPKNKI